MSIRMSDSALTDLPPVKGRQWARLCAASDVPADEGHRVGSVPPVAVFRQGGEFFCIDDTCTHEEYSLAEGWAENGAVECTLHCARFSLRTGEVLAPPATKPVATHPVAVVGEDLYGALPANYLTQKGG